MSHRLRISADARTFTPVMTPRLAVFAAKHAGQELEWDFTPKRRSLSQNARMWAVLMSAFEELGWEKDEAKTWCAEQFLEPVVKENFDGSRVEFVRKTSTLTVQEMSEFQGRIERYLIQNNIHIPYQGDER